MVTVVYATTNKGKLKEATLVGAELGVTVRGLTDIQGRGIAPEVEENGVTYEENCLLKARAYSEWSGEPVIADDAGLEVAALQGRPGLYSARFGGVEISWPERRALLLSSMGASSDRSARFICVVSYLAPGKDPVTVEGDLSGNIATEPRGDTSFGYDCLFIPEGNQKTLSELKMEGIVFDTHRKRAMRKLFARLSQDSQQK